MCSWNFSYLGELFQRQSVKVGSKHPKFFRFLRVYSCFLFFFTLINIPFYSKEKIEENFAWYETLINKGQNAYNGKITYWDQLPEGIKKLKLAQHNEVKTKLAHATALWFWWAGSVLIDGALCFSFIKLVPWLRLYYVFWALFSSVIHPIFKTFLLGNAATAVTENLEAIFPLSGFIIVFVSLILISIKFMVYLYLGKPQIKVLYAKPLA